MKNFRWPVAVLAFLLTFGLSVGAVFLRQRQMINEPLLKRIGEMEIVEQVSLENTDGQKIVSVKLMYVDNLAVAYKELHTAVKGQLGEDSYVLKISDNRDDALEMAYLAVHLDLYESEQQGNFADVGNQVKRTIAEFHVDEHLFTVDSRNIYLQMRKGNAYLFEIIERQNQGQEGGRV